MRYAFLLPLIFVAPLQAQEYNIKYRGTFLGLTIGSGEFTSTLKGNEYVAEGNVKSRGVASLFAGGSGNIRASGTIGANRLYGREFYGEVNGKKKESVLLQFANDKVSKIEFTPPRDVNPSIVPVLEEHKRNVFDPFAASIVMAQSVETALTPQSCNKTHQIFSGQIRYDATLKFERMEKVDAKGYEGNALVCSATFKLISGYRTDKRIAEENAKTPVTFWLIPFAKTKMLVPYKIEIKTKFGMGTVEAYDLDIGY